MLFEALNDSLQRGELWLVAGGMCRWHLRRDGQLTICEILVTEQRQGIGSRIVRGLARVDGARCLVAKCPADLPANQFWRVQGFDMIRTEMSKRGRVVNVWRLNLSTVPAETDASLKSQ